VPTATWRSLEEPRIAYSGNVYLVAHLSIDDFNKQCFHNQFDVSVCCSQQYGAGRIMDPSIKQNLLGTALFSSFPALSFDVM
jgi:hypothetical protein